MTTILTEAEGATVLRCEQDDFTMLDLLPLVDGYIEQATGRDWTLDDPVRPEAKAAARMLLVRWHEDPGGMAAGAALGFGLSAALTQLEGLALQLATDGTPDHPLTIVASVPPAGYTELAVAANLVIVFSNPMASGSTSQVRLETDAGASVAATNSLDATGKIMTINPTSSLGAATGYTLVIDHAADVYGQTLDTTIGFTTA